MRISVHRAFWVGPELFRFGALDHHLLTAGLHLGHKLIHIWVDGARKYGKTIVRTGESPRRASPHIFRDQMQKMLHKSIYAGLRCLWAEQRPRQYLMQYLSE